MALPVINDVYRCAVNYSVGGHPCTNVLHVYAESNPTPTAVGIVVADAWGSNTGFADLQADGCVYSSVEVTPLDGITPSAAVGFGTADNNNGTVAGSELPAGDAMVITINSATRGRSSNGRLYISGLATSQLETSGQGWDSAAITLAQNAMTSFRADIAAGLTSGSLSVASYTLEVAYDVVGHTARSYVASQRRRDH